MLPFSSSQGRSITVATVVAEVPVLLTFPIPVGVRALHPLETLHPIILVAFCFAAIVCGVSGRTRDHCQADDRACDRQDGQAYCPVLHSRALDLGISFSPGACAGA